jgi:CheY-like chemotaxis protein
MDTDLVTLRLLLVVPAASLRTLLRQPVEVMEADSVAAVETHLAGGSDLLVVDGAVPAQERGVICKAARGCKERPLIIIIGGDGGDAEIDGRIRRPTTAEDAGAILERCIRARLPTRALVIDDSSTMRGIVRKILGACRLPVQVSETHDGMKALEDLRSGKFDMVFLDCNMPGVDGFSILSELQQLEPRVAVVMMTSTADLAVAARAYAGGAAAFLKSHSFPPTWIACSTISTGSRHLPSTASAVMHPYCRAISMENSPLRMRPARPSANSAAASSP